MRWTPNAKEDHWIARKGRHTLTVWKMYGTAFWQWELWGTVDPDVPVYRGVADDIEAAKAAAEAKLRGMCV